MTLTERESIRSAVHEALLPLMRQVHELREGQEFWVSVTRELMRRRTDSTHLSILELARVFRISEASSRAVFGSILEAVPGTKRRGVPIEKAEKVWIALRAEQAAKATRKREREEKAARKREQEAREAGGAV